MGKIFLERQEIFKMQYKVLIKSQKKIENQKSKNCTMKISKSNFTIHILLYQGYNAYNYIFSHRI